MVEPQAHRIAKAKSLDGVTRYVVRCPDADECEAGSFEPYHYHVVKAEALDTHFSGARDIIEGVYDMGVYQV